jgi:DNA-binding NtrC family response regulator
VVPDRVLIVDDEAIVLDVLGAALVTKDLEVRKALTMAAALEWLHKEPMGLMMVDKNLPDGDGIALIKQCRELQPACGCMVMTGYPNYASILEALRLGAVDYLEKPFPRMEIIQEKVKAALNRQKLLMERELLHIRLRATQPDATSEDEVALLKRALEVVKEDAEKSLAELRASGRRVLADENARAERLNVRLTVAQTALRRTARLLAAMAADGSASTAHAEELKALRRDIAEALEEA